jgi:hypothetical protein
MIPDFDWLSSAPAFLTAMLCLFCMALAQLAIIPFLLRLRSASPLRARSLILPTSAGGLMAACLVIGAGEPFWFGSPPGYETVFGWSAVAASLVVWAGWVSLWLRKDRSLAAGTRFARQCGFLLAICVVWLLIGAIVFLVRGGGISGGLASMSVAFSTFCAASFALQPRAFTLFMDDRQRG